MDETGVLLASLRESRACELAFGYAWRRALDELPPARSRAAKQEREALLEVLAETRPAWRRAYEGEPATLGEAAAALLAQSLEEMLELAA